MFGHRDVVLELLKHGADPDQPSSGDDWTPMVHASRCCHHEIVQDLLDAGANISIANAMGVTPLHKAASFGQLAVFRKLVEMGASFDVQDADGNTPLHIASKCNFPLIVKFLLDKGASSTTNKSGQAPQDVASNPSISKMFATTNVTE